MIQSSFQQKFRQSKISLREKVISKKVAALSFAIDNQCNDVIIIQGIR